jgi:hypothetical protein
MEKISGIIPASPRTKVVDTSKAQPARPGAPAFGRPMGKNSLGDRITLSKIAEEMKAAEALTPSVEGPAALAVTAPVASAPTVATPAAAVTAPTVKEKAVGTPNSAAPQVSAQTTQAETYKPNPEAKRAKVVEALNKKFFEKPFEVSREGGATTASEEALARYNNVKNLKPDLEAQ